MEKKHTGEEGTNMKKLSSLLLVLLLLCTSAFASDAGTLDGQFADCTSRLNDYLLNAKDVEVDLDALKSDLDALGNYDGGTASLLSLYTQVLINLRDVRYAECEAPLYLLKANADKIVMTMLAYPDLYALGDIPTLEKYCQARMCEVQGDYAQAFQLYGSITSFYDSMSRATACYGRDSVAITTTQQPQTMSAPVQPLGQITSITTRSNNYSITIKWEVSGKFVSYTLYRRCDSKNGEFEAVTTLDANAEKKYIDYGVANARYYTYYVEGKDENSNTAQSSYSQVWADLKGEASGNKNENKNTNTNTNANANDNSNTSSNKNNNTSSSSSNATSNNTNQNTNNVMQNVTVIVPTAAPVQWSAWSEWSTTPVSSSATREIETKLEYEPIYVTKYHYRHWKYYNVSAKTYWYSYAEYTGSDYKSGSGKWEYKTTTTPLEKDKVVDGRQQYKGYWYLYDTTNEQDGTKTITYYRYRDRIN